MLVVVPLVRPYVHTITKSYIGYILLMILTAIIAVTRALSNLASFAKRCATASRGGHIGPPMAVVFGALEGWH